MERARIVKYSEVRVGDVVCSELDTLRRGSARRVLEVHESKDEKGPLVSLKLQVDNQSWEPFWRNASPDDIIILVGRPRPEGKTEDEARQFVMHCVRSVDQIPGDNATGATMLKEALDRSINSLGKLISAYELGKPEEPKQ